jgi:hypothetical protein
MADYYPLIARAISGLDASAPGESRRALYERARNALLKQIRHVQPPLTESEITRERLSLEEAIRKVESEAAQRRLDVARRRSVNNGPNLNDVFRVGSRPGVPIDPIIELEKLVSTTRIEGHPEDPLAELQKELNALSIGPRERAADSAHRRIILPPISAIPDQDEKRAVTFRMSRRGSLDLQPDPAADAFDSEQSQLYLRIRSQLSKIKEDVPTQERQQVDEVIDDFLDQPPRWDLVEFKRVLWLSGNALRTCLDQHDAVSSSSEPHYNKLPPGIAAALRKSVEAWNVFVLGDADLAQFDAKRVGPQEHLAILANISAARPIIEVAAADRNITTERAGKVLAASLKSADVSDGNLNIKQAQDVAEGTSRNAIIQLVRQAYLTAQKVADPKTEEDKKLEVEYLRGVASGLGKSVGSNIGNLTAAVVGGATAAAAVYAHPIFEFVAAHAGPLRAYFASVYQNDQMIQILNAIEIVRARIKSARASTD